LRPGQISGAGLLILMLVVQVGVAAEPPLAAGGAWLTTSMDAPAAGRGLLELTDEEDDVARAGERLFRRDWRARPATSRLLGPGAAASRCGACHVEAGPAGTPAARPASERLAPPLFGWGLLEAIPESTLANMADPHDRNGDGISGRLPEVGNLVTGGTDAGRFGWKASQPSLYQQIAGALMDDMGISTVLYPHAGSVAQPELTAAEVEAIERYVAGLAVPARRSRERSAVRQGERLFADAGCGSCHVPAQLTGDHDDPALSGQIIWPYSDLLLHDMGPALANPDGGHDAREWRTPPLWGLGLMLEHYPRRGLLHDGRADDLASAIAWHGGGASRARDAVRALGPHERAALLAFLRSL